MNHQFGASCQFIIWAQQVAGASQPQLFWRCPVTGSVPASLLPLSGCTLEEAGDWEALRICLAENRISTKRWFSSSCPSLPRNDVKKNWGYFAGQETPEEERGTRNRKLWNQEALPNQPTLISEDLVILLVFHVPYHQLPCVQCSRLLFWPRQKNVMGQAGILGANSQNPFMF